MVTLDKSSIGSPALTRPMHLDATSRNSPTRIAANSSNSDDTTRSPGSMAADEGVVTVCTAVNNPTAVVKAMVVSKVILHYKSGRTKNAAGKSSR